MHAGINIACLTLVYAIPISLMLSESSPIFAVLFLYRLSPVLIYGSGQIQKCLPMPSALCFAKTNISLQLFALPTLCHLHFSLGDISALTIIFIFNVHSMSRCENNLIIIIAEKYF